MVDLQNTIQTLAARAEREDAEKRIEALTQLLSALYDKAAAYTNFIMAAGYAAFFAIWSIMKDTMTRTEMLWAATVVTFSLMVFITWEISMMIARARNFRGLANTLNVPPEEFSDALAAEQRAEERFNVRMYRFWYVVLVLTIVPAFSGGGILLYSFIRQLFWAAANG